MAVGGWNVPSPRLRHLRTCSFERSEARGATARMSGTAPPSTRARVRPTSAPPSMGTDAALANPPVPSPSHDSNLGRDDGSSGPVMTKRSARPSPFRSAAPMKRTWSGSRPRSGEGPRTRPPARFQKTETRPERRNARRSSRPSPSTSADWSRDGCSIWRPRSTGRANDGEAQGWAVASPDTSETMTSSSRITR